MYTVPQISPKLSTHFDKFYAHINRQIYKQGIPRFYKFLYDSRVEPAFTVHLPDKQVKFTRSSNGLYCFNPPYNNNLQTCAINIPMESVEKNMKMITNRQIERAKLTRKIYHAMGTPSINNFKMIVTTNAIKIHL
jgi:hypothetical protein